MADQTTSPASVAHLEVLARALVDIPQPAFALDVARGEVLACNDGGAEALGIFSYADYPIALDPKMPALVKLAGAQIDGSGTFADDLIFKINGFERTLHCRVGAIGPMLIVLVTDGGNADTAPFPPIDASRLTVAGDDAADAAHTSGEPMPVAFEDADAYVYDSSEALKKAARRIRTAPLVSRMESLEAPPQGGRATSQPNVAEAGQRSPARTGFGTSPAEDFANLAHELKTPLSAIAAASEVMRDERLGAMGNARYLDYATDIHESARHALSVIAAMLGRGDGVAGEAAEGTSHPLALNPLVARTTSTLRPLADERGLLLAIDADKEVLQIEARPTAVRQILINLISNALKFTPRGGSVRVSTGRLEDGRVFLAVRDTGIGIGWGEEAVPVSHRDVNGIGHLAIAQAGAGGSMANGDRGLGGQGIGLMLVKRLVDDMGAQIEVDSAPECGTVVLVAFGAPAAVPMPRGRPHRSPGSAGI